MRRNYIDFKSCFETSVESWMLGEVARQERNMKVGTSRLILRSEGRSQTRQVTQRQAGSVAQQKKD